MIASGVLKLIGAVFEFFLGIPLIGGSFILNLLWTPLIFMLIYHIITLAISKSGRAPIWGPAVGIIASTVGIIPGVGMLLHWAAFFCLLVDGILTLMKKEDSSTINL
ncbi:hypothetical protein SAMN04487944_11269 [Gracilibacillus ureilyticus]|uniref:Uncharacterized protein n=1 Tax=Gracilibacillus ureilyticus TaxID=531814 RepID=A0A1H9SZZ2_9BACI|nr:hypothetical protein [Gracilibacillus ureilyticus]SER89943.1 hypothetical protein SAMN04487944_11269 [Gracilibacillus ureilyticus]